MENKEEKTTQEEIVDSLAKKVAVLEKREIVFPDYKPQFEELKKWMEDHLPDYNKPIAELKTTVRQHNLGYPAERIQSQISTLGDMVAKIPKELPVKNYHHFGPQTRYWITGGIVLLIVTAVSTGICFHLAAENSRMEANDIKFRMIRQVYPVQANWADKYYAANPEGMKDTTQRLENEAMERSEASDLADQTAREAEAARRHLRELKQKAAKKSE